MAGITSSNSIRSDVSAARLLTIISFRRESVQKLFHFGLDSAGRQRCCVFPSFQDFAPALTPARRSRAPATSTLKRPLHFGPHLVQRLGFIEIPAGSFLARLLQRRFIQ